MDVHARNLLSTWVNIMMLGMSVWQQRRLENWGYPVFIRLPFKMTCRATGTTGMDQN